MHDLVNKLMTELWSAIELTQRSRDEFSVSERAGWVVVEHRGRRRHYPLTREIGVMLTGDLRRGVFD